MLDLTEQPGHTMAQIELRELRKQQREDPIIGVWLRAVIDKTFPKKQLINNRHSLKMLRQYDQLLVYCTGK